MNWDRLAIVLLTACFFLNCYKIREIRVTNDILRDEIIILTKDNAMMVQRYTEMYHAYTYLDERFELHKAGHE